MVELIFFLAVSSTDYSVHRNFAADILNVSLRTLDRYTKKKEISSVRRGRQLYFSEEELLSFKGKLLAKELSQQMTPAKKPTKMKEFADVEAAQIRERSSVQEVHSEELDSLKQEFFQDSFEGKIYKQLYEESEKQVKELQGKWEMANYRVGQLEAQVKSMVPLLEYKKQQEELKLLGEENQFKKQDIVRLEQQLSIEQFAKKIYAGVLWTICSLVPMLLILRIFAS